MPDPTYPPKIGAEDVVVGTLAMLAANYDPAELREIADRLGLAERFDKCVGRCPDCGGSGDRNAPIKQSPPPGPPAPPRPHGHLGHRVDPCDCQKGLVLRRRLNDAHNGCCAAAKSTLAATTACKPKHTPASRAVDASIHGFTAELSDGTRIDPAKIQPNPKPTSGEGEG